MRYSSLAIAAALLLSGCGGRPRLESSSTLTVVNDQTLPAPQRADVTAPDRLALIGPLDIIYVDVFNVDALSRELQVDASGRITMPLVGSIEAGGKTRDELAELIAANLRGRYLKNPEVTVNIRSSVSQVVTVDGSVVEPGMYPVTNQMTLLRAIASAKGASEFAKLSDVVILRNTNGRKMAGLYNISAIRRGVYADPVVYAGDIITVGDSPARRLFRDLVSVSPLLTGPIIALLQ